jgi:hypothetical protein
MGHFFWSGQRSWRRLALVGEVAAGAEQSSKEHDEQWEGERNGRWPPVVTSGHRDKGASPHVAAPRGSMRGEGGHREQSRARGTG